MVIPPGGADDNRDWTELSRRHAVEVDPGRVLVVPGGKVTMFFAILMLGEPGAGMEVAQDAMGFARLGIGALCVGAGVPACRLQNPAPCRRKTPPRKLVVLCTRNSGFQRRSPRRRKTPTFERDNGQTDEHRF